VRTLVLASLLAAFSADAAPGCSGPRACTRDRSGTAAVLLEDVAISREPGEPPSDIRLTKGTEVRTHEIRGEWVYVHCDEDLPGGATSYTQGWVPARVLKR
jgi:hypothetical protein